MTDMDILSSRLRKMELQYQRLRRLALLVSFSLERC